MLAAKLIVVMAAAVGQLRDEMKPRLIAKTDAAIWHAIPVSDGSTGFLPSTIGHILTFTRLDTGEMAAVASVSKSSIIIPMGIDRVQTTWTFIEGIAADQERVYAVQRSIGSTKLAGGPPAALSSGEHRARLLVFRLKDGKALHSIELDEKKQKNPARPTADSGPLRLRDGGVELRGNRYDFPDDGSVKTSPLKATK